MSQHFMHLQPVFFNLVKSGVKTVELRAWDEKRKQIKPGDEIVFRTDGTTDTITVRVKYLVVAYDFTELFKTVDVKQTGFDSVEIALQTMEPFYSRAQQHETGVVGIGIELL